MAGDTDMCQYTNDLSVLIPGDCQSSLLSQRATLGAHKGVVGSVYSLQCILEACNKIPAGSARKRLMGQLGTTPLSGWAQAAADVLSAEGTLGKKEQDWTPLEYIKSIRGSDEDTQRYMATV
jgi:hypothetical protein